MMSCFLVIDFLSPHDRLAKSALILSKGVKVGLLYSLLENSCRLIWLSSSIFCWSYEPFGDTCGILAKYALSTSVFKMPAIIVLVLFFLIICFETCCW